MVGEVKLRGCTAIWAVDHLLVGEEDGISLVVGGPRLTLDEAIHIAESLR